MGVNVQTAKLIRELGKEGVKIKVWLAPEQPEPSPDPEDQEDQEEIDEVWNVSLVEREKGRRELLRISDQFFSEDAATQGMELLLKSIIEGPDPYEILRDQENWKAEQEALAKLQGHDEERSVAPAEDGPLP